MRIAKPPITGNHSQIDGRSPSPTTDRYIRNTNGRIRRGRRSPPADPHPSPRPNNHAGLVATLISEQLDTPAAQSNIKRCTDDQFV